MRTVKMKTFKKTATTAYLLMMGLSLSSCSLLGPKHVAKLPLLPVPKEQPDKQPKVVFKELQNKPRTADTMKPASELFPGTDRFVPGTVQQHKKTAPKGAGSINLNFDEADIGEVAKIILEQELHQSYVLSPKVAGKVTLQTTEPLTKEELLPTLEMLLRMNNAALIKDGRIYRIEPASEALYSSNLASNRSGYQTRVIPVRNIAVQDIADIIKPLVHEKTILNVDGTRNILVASGTADEIARVMDMVNTFDIDVLKGRSFGLFPLAHIDPETVIKELEGIFQKDKADESEFFQFIAIERLNAVLAVTHQARYLHDIENWVTRLDRANTATGGGVNVYRVQNVDAEELASTLNEIFTGAAKKDKSAKVAPGQKAAEATNKQPTQKQTIQKTSAVSKKSAQTGDGQVSNVDDVKIIADVANNSIVIVATPQAYETILPVIKQLDVLPLQVLIDATIVEVTLKDDLQYGISWYLSQGNSALGSNKAGATLLGTAAAAAAAASTGGLSAVYSSGSVRALLNAESMKNNVNVISSPSLMVLNNQEASIQVGDEIPLRTSQSTNVTNVNQNTGVLGNNGTQAGGLVTSGIQQRKTGVKLKVKPRVNANGLVIMDIEQSVENVQPTNPTISGSGIDSPTIATREITSSVAVQNGEVIVLGGLIREDNAYNKSGIPFLHTLPLIGPLFGNTINNKNRTELVVLITPRVVQSKQDARLVTDEFKRKLTGIYQEVSYSNDETPPNRGKKSMR